MKMTFAKLIGQGGRMRDVTEGGNEIAPQNPALDGVRAVAIVMVLAFHANAVRQHGSVGALLAQGAAFGWADVDLFFVLSGCLIAGVSLDSRSHAEAKALFAGFFSTRGPRSLPH